MTMQELHKNLCERPHLIPHLSKESLVKYTQWLFEHDLMSALLDTIELHTNLNNHKIKNQEGKSCHLEKMA